MTQHAARAGLENSDEVAHLDVLSVFFSFFIGQQTFVCLFCKFGKSRLRRGIVAKTQPRLCDLRGQEVRDRIEKSFELGQCFGNHPVTVYQRGESVASLFPREA